MHRARSSIIGLVVLATVAVPAQTANAGPASTSFRFAGSGYGHAVGLSQYGAYAQALAGRSAETIVRHYYRGTSITSRAAESIRVLLESSSDVVVTSASTFNAYQGSTRLGSSSSTLPYMRATPTSSGYRLQRGETWQGPWTTLTTTTGIITFRPGSSHMTLVRNGGATRRYRGNIQARRVSSSTVRSINVIDLELYLRGVVPWEMPASWHSEALQAQALVARSYAVHRKLAARATGASYDICDTTACQVYGGYDAEHSRTNAAISGTARRVVTHPDPGTTQGGVILATFSSSSGGRTESNTDGFGSSVQYPYLTSVDDPWSLDDAVNNSYASWERSVTQSALRSETGLDDVWTITVTDRTVSGSAATVRFSGMRNGARATVDRTGRWTRSAFGLPSAFIASVFIPPFSDDDGSPHEVDIAALYRNDIVQGCGEDLFCPNEPVRRDHIAAYFSRAFNLATTQTDHFTDDDGTPHQGSINRAASAGVMQGCGDERFCPFDNLRRDQAAALVVRALGLPAATRDYFTDDETSPHQDAINRIAEAGISKGCGRVDGFCPFQTLTRAQMSTFLSRALGLS